MEFSLNSSEWDVFFFLKPISATNFIRNVRASKNKNIKLFVLNLNFGVVVSRRERN